VKKIWMLLALTTGTAIAGSGSGVMTGFISGVNGNGTAIFVFTTAALVAAPCNTTQRFAIVSSDPKYKDTVAAIMEAHATGASVTVIATGNCTVLQNAEDLSYLCVGTIPC
jgi:hypothetical protein